MGGVAGLGGLQRHHAHYFGDARAPRVELRDQLAHRILHRFGRRDDQRIRRGVIEHLQEIARCLTRQALLARPAVKPGVEDTLDDRAGPLGPRVGQGEELHACLGHRLRCVEIGKHLFDAAEGLRRAGDDERSCLRRDVHLHRRRTRAVTAGRQPAAARQAPQRLGDLARVGVFDAEGAQFDVAAEFRAVELAHELLEAHHPLRRRIDYQRVGLSVGPDDDLALGTQLGPRSAAAVHRDRGLREHLVERAGQLLGPSDAQREDADLAVLVVERRLLIQVGDDGLDLLEHVGVRADDQRIGCAVRPNLKRLLATLLRRPAVVLIRDHPRHRAGLRGAQRKELWSGELGARRRRRQLERVAQHALETRDARVVAGQNDLACRVVDAPTHLAALGLGHIHGCQIKEFLRAFRDAACVGVAHVDDLHAPRRTPGRVQPRDQVVDHAEVFGGRGDDQQTQRVHRFGARRLGAVNSLGDQQRRRELRQLRTDARRTRLLERVRTRLARQRARLEHRPQRVRVPLDRLRLADERQRAVVGGASHEHVVVTAGGFVKRASLFERRLGHSALKRQHAHVALFVALNVDGSQQLLGHLRVGAARGDQHTLAVGRRRQTHDPLLTRREQALDGLDRPLCFDVLERHEARGHCAIAAGEFIGRATLEFGEDLADALDVARIAQHRHLAGGLERDDGWSAVFRLSREHRFEHAFGLLGRDDVHRERAHHPARAAGSRTGRHVEDLDERRDRLESAFGAEGDDRVGAVVRLEAHALELVLGDLAPLAALVDEDRALALGDEHLERLEQVLGRHVLDLERLHALLEQRLGVDRLDQAGQAPALRRGLGDEHRVLLGQRHDRAVLGDQR